MRNVPHQIITLLCQPQSLPPQRNLYKLPPMNRRQFIAASAGASAGVLAGCHSFTSSNKSTAATYPKPCAPTSWQKHGIVLEPSEPWEGANIQNFTTCAEPLEHGRWRLWYSVNDHHNNHAIAIAEGVPGEPMKKTIAVCSPGEPADAPLSIGNLPSTWRPVQPVHIRLRDGRHRLYFWVHAPQVVRYLVAESDDGRRYRVLDPLRPVLYHLSDRAAFGVASPDGVMVHKDALAGRPANEPRALSRQISNDATNIYQLPDGTFEMYSVGIIKVSQSDPAYIAEDNAPGWLRVIDRYASPDGINFLTRQRIIQRDAKDPADQQFYYLSVTHTPKGRVGLLGHYRCEAQTMDIEWCFSRDGVEWQRPMRSGWIARGNPPAPDCFGMYANNSVVHHNGHWHLFYTAANEAHNHKHFYGKPRQVVMYATTRSIWA